MREAAELTWPQLMHLMGIDQSARDDDSAARLTAVQDAIFDGIVGSRQMAADRFAADSGGGFGGAGEG